MVQFIPLPEYKPSPLLNLAPINEALDARQRQANLEQRRLMEERRMLEQRRQFDASHGLAQRQDVRAERLLPGQIDAQRAGIESQRASAAHARAAEGRAAALHPSQVATHQAQATIAGVKAQDAVDPQAVHARRAETARQYGLRDGSPEFNYFVLNGQLPARTSAAESTLTKETDKARVEMAQKEIQAAYGAQDTHRVIAELRALGKVAKTGAVGPIAGSETYQTLVGAIPLSRLFGNANPEVNAKIRRLQAQLVVAGGEKMRGLGAQSDADAKRLEIAIGSLTSARSQAEFDQALQIIEDAAKGAYQRGAAAAREFPTLGGRLVQPAPGRQENPGATPQPIGQPSETKTIRDKTYLKIDGQWYEQ